MSRIGRSDLGRRIQLERLADDRTNRAVAADQRIQRIATQLHRKDRPFQSRDRHGRLRSIRICIIDDARITYFTHVINGVRRDRRMRCRATWRTFRLRYGRDIEAAAKLWA